MILTTHLLAGAAIGKNINNPILVIPLSLVIHYAMDSMRHGDYIDKNSNLKNTWWKIALDLLTGISIVLFYILAKIPSQDVMKGIMLGSFFSVFPDFLTLLYWKFNFSLLIKIHSFHERVHRIFRRDDVPWNLHNARNDILISLVAILFLLI